MPAGAKPASTKNSNTVWEVGKFVTVDARTTPGINRPGGVGKITKLHYCDNGYVISVDVKYVMSGCDKQLDLAFVHPMETLERQSRSRRGRDFYSASPAKRGSSGTENKENKNNNIQREQQEERKQKAKATRTKTTHTTTNTTTTYPPPAAAPPAVPTKPAKKSSDVNKKKKRKDTARRPLPLENKEPNRKKRRREQKYTKENERQDADDDDIPRVVQVVETESDVVSPLTNPEIFLVSGTGASEDGRHQQHPLIERPQSPRRQDAKRRARRALKSEVLQTMAAKLRRKPKKLSEAATDLDVDPSSAIDESKVYKTPSPHKPTTTTTAAAAMATATAAAPIISQSSIETKKNDIKVNILPASPEQLDSRNPLTERMNRPNTREKTTPTSSSTKALKGSLQASAEGKPMAESCRDDDEDDSENCLERVSKLLSRLFQRSDGSIEEVELRNGLKNDMSDGCISKCLNKLASGDKIMISEGYIYQI